MIINEPIQTHHSSFVKSAIGLLIFSYTPFYFCKKAPELSIFSDLTIEILTLNFPTRWQESIVIYLLVIYI